MQASYERVVRKEVELTTFPKCLGGKILRMQQEHGVVATFDAKQNSRQRLAIVREHQNSSLHKPSSHCYHAYQNKKCLNNEASTHLSVLLFDQLV